MDNPPPPPPEYIKFNKKSPRELALLGMALQILEGNFTREILEREASDLVSQNNGFTDAEYVKMILTAILNKNWTRWVQLGRSAVELQESDRLTEYFSRPYDGHRFGKQKQQKGFENAYYPDPFVPCFSQYLAECGGYKFDSLKPEDSAIRNNYQMEEVGCLVNSSQVYLNASTSMGRYDTTEPSYETGINQSIMASEFMDADQCKASNALDIIYDSERSINNMVPLNLSFPSPTPSPPAPPPSSPAPPAKCIIISEPNPPEPPPRPPSPVALPDPPPPPAACLFQITGSNSVSTITSLPSTVVKGDQVVTAEGEEVATAGSDLQISTAGSVLPSAVLNDETTNKVYPRWSEVDCDQGDYLKNNTTNLKSLKHFNTRASKFQSFNVPTVKNVHTKYNPKRTVAPSRVAVASHSMKNKPFVKQTEQRKMFDSAMSEGFPVTLQPVPYGEQGASSCYGSSRYSPSRYGPSQYGLTRYVTSMNVPPQYVPARRVPTWRVPTRNVPFRPTPFRDIPSQYPSTQYRSSQRAYSQSVPSRYVFSRHVPSWNVPFQNVHSNYVPSQYVPTQRMPFQYIPSHYMPPQHPFPQYVRPQNVPFVSTPFFSSSEQVSLEPYGQHFASTSEIKTENTSPSVSMSESQLEVVNMNIEKQADFLTVRPPPSLTVRPPPGFAPIHQTQSEASTSNHSNIFPHSYSTIYENLNLPPYLDPPMTPKPVGHERPIPIFQQQLFKAFEQSDASAYTLPNLPVCSFSTSTSQSNFAWSNDKEDDSKINQSFQRVYIPPDISEIVSQCRNAESEPLKTESECLKTECKPVKTMAQVLSEASSKKNR